MLSVGDSNRVLDGALLVKNENEMLTIASFLPGKKGIEIRSRSKTFAGEKFRSIPCFNPIFNPKKRT